MVWTMTTIIQEVFSDAVKIILMLLGFVLIYNVMEVSHRYAVQVSDTTMLPMAASLPGHKNL